MENTPWFYQDCLFILYNQNKTLMRPQYTYILCAKNSWVKLEFNPAERKFRWIEKWILLSGDELWQWKNREREVLQWQKKVLFFNQFNYWYLFSFDSYVYWSSSPLFNLTLCLNIPTFLSSPQLWHRAAQSPSLLWMAVTCCSPTPLLVTRRTWWPRRSSWTLRTCRCSPATLSAWCQPGGAACRSLPMLIINPPRLCLCKPRP